MFTVTVRDHIMIAHSLRGEVFGPAQRLHGATYVVDADVPAEPARRRRRAWSTSAGPPTQLRAVLAELDLPQPGRGSGFAGLNTTTEVLAQVIADRLAERVRAGCARRGRRRLTGSPSPCASRTSPGPATSARCEQAARGRARRHRRSAGGPAAATSTTAGSAAGWTSWAGRSPCTRWPAPGHGPTRRRRPGWRRRSTPSPTAPGAGRRPGRSASPRVLVPAAGPAAAGRAGAPAAGRRRRRCRARGEAAVLAAARGGDRPPAAGRGDCSGDLYGLPAPVQRRRARRRPGRPGARHGGRRRAGVRGGARPPPRGTTCWPPRWSVADLTGVPPGRRLDRDPAFADAIRGRIAAAGLTAASSSPASSSTHRYAAPPTCWWWRPRAGETYGMVVTEALARGVPVAGGRRGWRPEALGGRGPAARLLVAPGGLGRAGGGAPGLADDAGLRERLRTCRPRAAGVATGLVAGGCGDRRRDGVTGAGLPAARPPGFGCASRPTRPRARPPWLTCCESG